MSNYNWARGTIKIPTKDYPKVRDALIRFHNERQQELLEKAVRVYEVVKGLKFKRGANKHPLIADEWDADEAFGMGNLLNRTFGRTFDPEDREMIATSIFPNQKNEEGRPIYGKHVTRAQKPKKKDFPLATKATRSFSSDDLTITLDPKAKTVHFDGEENNRAQERALESKLAGALFNALRGVTWTARTGGKIIGNDEYNQDECEGGGANYVLHEWSHKVTPRRQTSYSGGYGGGALYGRRY